MNNSQEAPDQTRTDLLFIMDNLQRQIVLTNSYATMLQAKYDDCQHRLEKIKTKERKRQ